MSSKENKQSSALDITLWTIALLFIGAGVVVNFYFANYALAIRLIGWLFLAIVVVTLILQTQSGRTLWEFIRQARVELRKVFWPTRQETVQTTLVVVAMVVIMALFLWGIDTLLLWIVGILTGQTG